MKHKKILTAISLSLIGIVSFSAISLSVINSVKTELDTITGVKKEINTDDISVENIDLRAKAPEYGLNYPVFNSWGAFNASTTGVTEDVIDYKEINNSLVNSTLEIKMHNPELGVGGIARQGWNLAIYNSKLIYQINDYSRYIKSITITTMNSGATSSVLNLYTDRDALTTPVMSGNAATPSTTMKFEIENDDSIMTNAVCIVDTPTKTTDHYAFNTLSYTLGYINDATTQATFFAEAFLREMVCDGVGLVAPLETTWNAFKDRISNMSEDALELLKTSSSNQLSESVIEQALARYDLIATKYGYANFLNRDNVVSQSNIFLTPFGSNNQNNTPILALLFSCIAICGVSLIVIIKKRKEHSK